jgi:hypothetical protein
MKSRPFQVGRIYTDTDDATILADGQTMRVRTMQRDSAAGFCKECQGRGRWTDMNLTCPYCSGSGMILANGDPVDETVSATSNNTEAARDGEFGSTDHALTNDAKIRDAVARDRAWRDATAGSRPGWYITDEGRAHHVRMADVYAEVDNERENAWKDVSTFEENPATLSKPPTPEELEQIKHMSNDGRTTAQIAKDHQARMAEETRNYEAQISNAYKNLR